MAFKSFDKTPRREEEMMEMEEATKEKMLKAPLSMQKLPSFAPQHSPKRGPAKVKRAKKNNLRVLSDERS